MDTDGDGELSDSDASVIGLAKPDGNGFTTALKDVDRVLSFQMDDASNLSLIFQKDRTVRRARFSLADFKLVSDQLILTMPNAR